MPCWGSDHHHPTLSPNIRGHGIPSLFCTASWHWLWCSWFDENISESLISHSGAPGIKTTKITKRDFCIGFWLLVWARLVYKQLFLDFIPEDKRQFYKVYIEADGEKYFCPRRHISKKTDLQGHRGIKGKILSLKFQRFKKSNVCFNIKTPWRRKSSIYNSFTIYLRFGSHYFIIS